MMTPLKAEAQAPRRLVILGATGSVGCSVADVLDGAPGRFQVEAVAGGKDVQSLARMAIRLKAKFAAIADPAGYNGLKDALAGHGIACGAGLSAVIEAAVYPAEIVVAAIVGTAGVLPTYAAIRAGRTIALANKECLVCAGAPFMRDAALYGARLLPLDSEHNAIFQALGGSDPAIVERMWLTASGGPFRGWDARAIANATPHQALAHPNWAMGPKISVDSASLMNKGLELIEAHHLFAIGHERLDVLVHPQSIVHGLVSFADGSVTAGMAMPDMKVPIAHCLAWPDRMQTVTRRLDLAALGTLTFEAPDLARFPALRLAFEALRAGGGYPTILNAANEIAVAAFLEGRIAFGGMASFVQAVCDKANARGLASEPQDVEAALGIDHIVREMSRADLA